MCAVPYQLGNIASANPYALPRGGLSLKESRGQAFLQKSGGLTTYFLNDKIIARVVKNYECFFYNGYYPSE